MDIPPEFFAGAAKILSRAIGRPAAAVFRALVAGPLERLDSKRQLAAEIDLRLMGTLSDKAVEAIEQLSAEQLLTPILEQSTRRTILKQYNFNKIVALALEQLPKDSSTKQRTEPSDRFLDAFEPVAENTNEPDMQALFSRILAGEIQKPGSFSVRAIQVANQLDQSTALLFQLLCSMALVRETIPIAHRATLTPDKIVCSLGGNVGNNALSKYGTDFTNLSRLAEYGLVVPSISVADMFGDSIINEGRKFSASLLPILHQGQQWILQATTDDERLKGLKVRYKHYKNYKLTGVGFSAVGHELYQVVEQIRTDEYTADLIKFFYEQGLDMLPVDQFADPGWCPPILTLD